MPVSHQTQQNMFHPQMGAGGPGAYVNGMVSQPPGQDGYQNYPHQKGSLKASQFPQGAAPPPMTIPQPQQFVPQQTQVSQSGPPPPHAGASNQYFQNNSTNGPACAPGAPFMQNGSQQSGPPQGQYNSSQGPFPPEQRQQPPPQQAYTPAPPQMPPQSTQQGAPLPQATAPSYSQGFQQSMAQSGGPMMNAQSHSGEPLPPKAPNNQFPPIPSQGPSQILSQNGAYPHPGHPPGGQQGGTRPPFQQPRPPMPPNANDSRSGPVGSHSQIPSAGGLPTLPQPGQPGGPRPPTPHQQMQQGGPPSGLPQPMALPGSHAMMSQSRGPAGPPMPPPGVSTMSQPMPPGGGGPGYGTAHARPQGPPGMAGHQMPPGGHPMQRPQQAQQFGGMPGGPPGPYPQGMPPGPPGGGHPGAPGHHPEQMGGMPGAYPQGMPPGPPGPQQQMGGYPNQGPPGGMYQQPQQPPRKIDPSAMPSVVQVIDDDRKSRSGLFQTGYPRAETPPLSTTDFFCDDQGNCGPSYMRSSVYSVPATADMVKSSGIPMTVTISPMADPHPQEREIPVINLGELGPVRCNRCKAYMSPFMEFFDGGRRFNCPFCKTSTEVPQEYFAHMDPCGRRVDINERPELIRGSYEFIATKEYCEGGLLPKPPAYIFALDVSYNAVKCGLVHFLCERVKSVLTSLEPGVLVGFITYDHQLHFYNLKSSVGQPKMYVVSDVEETFVPLVEGFFVDPLECGEAIDELLKAIPGMFAETRVTEVCFAPIIQAGLDALKSDGRPGKLLLFHTTLPILAAPGRLDNRDDRKLLGTEKEKSILAPNKGVAEFYEGLAKDCVQGGCAVDAFLFPNGYIDVATMTAFCATTGGQVYRYLYFQVPVDGERFYADLARDLAKPTAFNAVMRVRTSTGIRPVEFYGNFYMEGTTNIEFGAIDSEKAITIEIRHDDKLDPSEGAFVQSALLYTNAQGQRRVRIHNLSFKVSADLPQVYRDANLDALVAYLLKSCERICRDKGHSEMRSTLIQRCVQILATYRDKCANPSSPGQLILPEGMKVLPLYAACMVKADAFIGGSEMTSDDRSQLMGVIPPIKVADALAFLYPRLYEVSTGDAGEGSEMVEHRCSYGNLSSERAYILENGFTAFLWIGTGVDPSWISDIFAVGSFAQIPDFLQRQDNPRSTKLHELLARLSQEHTQSLKVFVIKQGDKLEPWFKHFLVEDPGAGGGKSSPGYVDFLCFIHKEIKELLS